MKDNHMKLSRFGIMSLMAVAALSTAACGKTVETGNRGVMIKDFGGGAQRTPLGQGWHATMLPGEHIVQFPITPRTIKYTGDNRVTFADMNGQRMSADVAITLAVAPAKVADVYILYKSTLDELVENQIRTDVVAEIAKESDKVPIEGFLGGGRQAVLDRALVTVQRKWSPLGVNVTQLQWVGPINLPEAMTSSIAARAKADADVATAKAQETAAVAEAAAQRARAQGTADAARIRGQMLASNPQILEEQRIAKWRGICPINGSGACIVGAGAPAIVGQ